MTEPISKSVVDSTIIFIDMVGWRNFQPFELIIHNIIPAPLPFASKEEFFIKAFKLWHNETIKSLSSLNFQATLHERFFEIFMTRFEILNPYKKLLKEICHPFILIPVNAQNFAKPWWQSISELYTLAINDQSNQNYICHKKKFLWFYIKTLPTWFQDESPDLAATMSAWDQNLRKFLSLDI